jgi:non-heme chloroperoxidase
LQAARRADAEACPHEESQIEPADMNEQPLQDVRVAPQMRPTQTTGLIEVCIRPLFDAAIIRSMDSATSLIAGLYLLAAQSGTTWRDPSPHQGRFVTVESSVRLEVLDWGGTGRPILFVGCYLTGHVYDNIAPKLTDQFRVYAVTRRGVGASDHPATGYDPQRRADDILEVIGAVGMQKPILIGSSCGGDILHTLGAQHPDRLGGLVYLDGAEDPTLTMADYGFAPADVAQILAHMPAQVGKSVPVTFPEGERRQMTEWPLDPAIRQAIVDDNKVRPDYARIRVPVLAIYRTETMEQTLKDYPPINEEQRAALNQSYAGKRARLAKWQRDLLAGVPTARIVELPDANLYMFLSNEADVLREVRAFAAALQQ